MQHLSGFSTNRDVTIQILLIGKFMS